MFPTEHAKGWTGRGRFNCNTEIKAVSIFAALFLGRFVIDEAGFLSEAHSRRYPLRGQPVLNRSPVSTPLTKSSERSCQPKKIFGNFKNR